MKLLHYFFMITLLIFLITSVLSESTIPIRLFRGDEKLDLIPKTYYISSEEHFQRLAIPSIPSCPHPPDNSDHQTIKTGVTLYRPDVEALKEIGLVITSYLIKTKCYSNWYGSCTETTIIDTPTDISSMDQDNLNYLLAKTKTELHSMKLNYPMMETFGESLTKCFWLRTEEKTTKVIRYYATEINWSLKNYMLSPAVQQSCTRSKGSCDLGNSSRIYFDTFVPSSSDLDCKVKSLGTYVGLLTYSVDNLSNVRLHNFRSDKGILFISLESKFPSNLDLECNISTKSIFSSPEGFLYSFMTHDGVDVLKLIQNDKKSFRSPLLIRPKRAVAFSDSVPPVDISNFSPHFLLSSIERNNSTTLTRIKRSTVIDYPFSSRDLWFLEHSSWSISEFEMTIQTLTGETIQTMKHIWYISCVNHYNNLLLGRGILQWSTIPFLRNYLDTSGFLSYYKEPYIYFKLGVPIVELRIKEPLNFLKGKLAVSFKTLNSNSMDGYLHPESGIVTMETTTKDPVDNISPSTFLIPLLKKGSYDLFLKDVINTWEDLDISRLEGKDFIFETPYLDIQDELENQKRTENSHSSLFIGTGSWLNAGSMFQRLTEHSDIGHFLDQIVIPIILIIVGVITFFVITKIILVLIDCFRPTQTKANLF